MDSIILRRTLDTRLNSLKAALCVRVTCYTWHLRLIEISAHLRSVANYHRIPGRPKLILPGDQKFDVYRPTEISATLTLTIIFLDTPLEKRNVPRYNNNNLHIVVVRFHAFASALHPRIRKLFVKVRTAHGKSIPGGERNDQLTGRIAFEAHSTRNPCTLPEIGI